MEPLISPLAGLVDCPDRQRFPQPTAPRPWVYKQPLEFGDPFAIRPQANATRNSLSSLKQQDDVIAARQLRQLPVKALKSQVDLYVDLVVAKHRSYQLHFFGESRRSDDKLGYLWVLRRALLLINL